MRKIVLLTALLASYSLIFAQRIETTVKTAKGKTIISVRAAGGDIAGQVSNVIFNVAVPKEKDVKLIDVKILEPSRLPLKHSKSVPAYSDDKYNYFLLCFMSPKKKVEFVNLIEYDLLELIWNDDKDDFPVSLISLEEGAPNAASFPSMWLNYFEVSGKQYSTGDHLFYQSATSTSPVQMAADYSSGTASVSSSMINTKPTPTAVTTGKLIIDGLFPNPAGNTFNLKINAPKRDEMTLLVTDLSGRTMKKQIITVEPGNNKIPVDISKLASGTYIVKIICKSNCEEVFGKFNKQ